jgi:ribonuclease P protein component
MTVPPSKKFRFGRKARIKQGRDFKRIREKGQRIANGCLVLNWFPLPEGSASRLGVVTAGKLGGAVVRNRARRIMREAFRVHQHELALPVDLVLVARASIVGAPFAKVEQDFLESLKRANLLKRSDMESAQ